jgi:hypothetical protein
MSMTLLKPKAVPNPGVGIVDIANPCVKLVVVVGVGVVVGALANPNLRDKYEPENIKRILINVACRC